MAFPKSSYVAAGQTYRENLHNDLRDDMLYLHGRMISFGGDGSDGALSIDTGTTTIDCQNKAIVVKNYTSISITGDGKLAFSNPHANGTIIILKSQGNVTITSSTEPAIDVSELGGAGGALGGANGIAGSGKGYNGSGGLRGRAHANSINPRSGGGGGNLDAGVGGNLIAQYDSIVVSTVPDGGIGSALPPLNQYSLPLPGGSGGGGAAGWGYPDQTTASAGGRGGGALLIECLGALNFSGKIWSKGGTSSVANGRGGGGAGGSVMILYKTLTASTGTITVTGGTGGNDGSDGQSLVEQLRKTE